MFFYKDATELIPKFSSTHKLAIVSDAWPSILAVFDKNNMSCYFDCFVISSVLGTVKPDKAMYKAALEGLNVKPNEAVFIDDNLNNCIGAMNLGINAVLLCRDKKDYVVERIKCIGKKYHVINNLYQLEKYI